MLPAPKVGKVDVAVDVCPNVPKAGVVEVWVDPNPNPVLAAEDAGIENPEKVGLVVAGVLPNVPKPVFVVAVLLPNPKPALLVCVAPKLPKVPVGADVVADPNEKEVEPNVAAKDFLTILKGNT